MLRYHHASSLDKATGYVGNAIDLEEGAREGIKLDRNFSGKAPQIVVPCVPNAMHKSMINGIIECGTNDDVNSFTAILE